MSSDPEIKVVKSDDILALPRLEPKDTMTSLWYALVEECLKEIEDDNKEV